MAKKKHQIEGCADFKFSDVHLVMLLGQCPYFIWQLSFTISRHFFAARVGGRERCVEILLSHFLQMAGRYMKSGHDFFLSYSLFTNFPPFDAA
jgi:hypothetical protein